MAVAIRAQGHTDLQLAESDRQRMKSRILGSFDNLVLYVEKPATGERHWELVNKSDVATLPPGIEANIPLEEETRLHEFKLDLGRDEVTRAYIFCRVESGK